MFRVGMPVVLLVAVFTVDDAAIAEIKIDRDRGVASIHGEGVAIQDVRPGVQLLDSSDKLIDWRIVGPPHKSEVHETETPLGPGRATTLLWSHPGGYQLAYQITQLQNHPGGTLRCEFSNRSDKPIRLRRFFLIDTPPGALQVDGSTAAWMTASRYLKYARYYDTLHDLIERGQLRTDQSSPDDTVREIPYEEDFTLYTNHGESGLSISAVGDVSWVWTHLHTPKNREQLRIDVTSEMTGVLVEPDESRSSETILVSTASWKSASEAVVQYLRTTFKPRDTPPLFGWCSWYCAGAHVTEQHCQKVASYVAKHRDRYPFQTLQVDEGWSIGRHRWHANGKFKRGMGALASAFREANVMPGVWLCPATPNSQRIIDGRLVHFGGQGGHGVRAFDKSWYVGARIGKPTTGSLDPSSPAAAEYMTGELKRLYDQGYRYFKTDFSLVADIESGYWDPKATRFEMQRRQYQLWRDAIGEESYLLACNGGPARAVLGIADATRIGTDSNQKWAFCYPPNEFGKPSNVHGSWFPILQIGCASFYNRLIACDPDVTRIDDTGNALLDPRFVGQNKKAQHYQNMDTVQTFHGILSLYGGTMMVSDLLNDSHFLTENKLRMLEIMHPVTPEKGYNLSGGTDVLNSQFGFVANRDWGKWISMVTWNPDHHESQNLKIDRAPAETADQKFHVWSFWEEKYHGIQDLSYEFDSVPKYCSRLLRLTPIDSASRPTLIGSNLHMSMGAAEIANVRTTDDTVLIELVPTAGALEGQLIFSSEDHLEVSSATGCEVFVYNSDESIFTVVITDRDRNSDQKITLQKTENPRPTLRQIREDLELGPKWRSSTSTTLKTK